VTGERLAEFWVERSGLRRKSERSQSKTVSEIGTRVGALSIHPLRLATLLVLFSRDVARCWFLRVCSHWAIHCQQYTNLCFVSPNLGEEYQSQTIDVSIWLKLHNRGGFDGLAQDLYDPISPCYRNWLKTEIAARFAPTAA
jgi:hypothetical protein